MAHATKVLGPIKAKIDRPKGYKKTWSSGRSWVYPVSYGYFPGINGEDGEGLDVFLGDDEDGHKESFLKLKPGEDGTLVPDETKFILGVTDAERQKIHAFYGDELSNLQTYANWGQVLSAVNKFRPKKKSRYTPQGAAVEDASQVYGVKAATLQNLLEGQEVLPTTSDAGTPGRQHWAEQADLADKLMRGFKGFDDAQNVVSHDESSFGSMPVGGTLG